MEPWNERRRSYSKRLTFLGPRNLLAWLDGPAGREVREAIEEKWLPTLAARVFDNSEESKAVIAEVLERHGKETRCLIVAQPMENGSVYLEVFGPRELKVHIVTLPVVPTTPEGQRFAEQLVEVELPRAYKPLFYPTGKRMAEVIEVLTPEQYLAWEREKEFRREWFNACDRIKVRK